MTTTHKAGVADYTVENHYGTYLLRPNNEVARDWLADNASEDAQWRAGALFVGGQRYIRQIANKLIEDGFNVD